MQKKKRTENKTKKKKTKGILWAALLLGLLMPFGIYFALQSGQMLLAGICFGLIALSMFLTAWQG